MCISMFPILIVIFGGFLLLFVSFLFLFYSQKKSKITVSALFIYPIKSCAGISLKSHQMDQFGFVYDRKWVIVKKETMKFVTQRDVPKMSLICPSIHESDLHVDAPNMSTFVLPLNGLNTTGPEVVVKVWSSKCPAFDEGDEAARWFQKAMDVSYEVRLMRMGNTMKRSVHSQYQILNQNSLLSFTDAFPFLLVSEESIEALNKLIDPNSTTIKFDVRHFRPNIVVRGCEAWAENRWKLIQIGNNFFYVLKRCERCKITTVNPDQGATHHNPTTTTKTTPRTENQENDSFDKIFVEGIFESEEPLRTINQKLNGEFAVNMSHSIASYGQRICVGDRVKVFLTEDTNETSSQSSTLILQK